MNINIGSTERIIRIVVGLVLVGLAATHHLGAWAYLGVIPLLTGIFGWCPPYSIFGINTCRVKSKQP